MGTVIFIPYKPLPPRQQKRALAISFAISAGCAALFLVGCLAISQHYYGTYDISRLLFQDMQPSERGVAISWSLLAASVVACIVLSIVTVRVW